MFLSAKKVQNFSISLGVDNFTEEDIDMPWDAKFSFNLALAS
jgi:hypothetical protein